MWEVTRENVKTLNDVELWGLLFLDTAHGHIYRPEIQKRPTAAKAIEAAHKKLYEPPPPVPKGVDIRSHMEAAMVDKTVSLENLCRIMRDSSWERTDRLMNKNPQDVNDFLRDMIIKDCWFDELNEGQRNFMKMICDAYNRWRG